MWEEDEMKLGALIKSFRIKNNMTMQEFADSAGLSKGYVSMLEKGVHPQNNKKIVPSISTFQKVAQVLGLSVNQLVEVVDGNQLINISSDKSASPIGVRIPVLGEVVAGVPIDAVEEYLDWEEITPELAETGEFFALKIKGDSMEPRIVAGDVVIVRMQPTAETGDVVIAMVNGDDACCKRFIKHDEGITLQSFNPSYTPMFFTKKEIETLPVTIVGKVIENRQKY